MLPTTGKRTRGKNSLGEAVGWLGEQAQLIHRDEQTTLQTGTNAGLGRPVGLAGGMSDRAASVCVGAALGRGAVFLKLAGLSPAAAVARGTRRAAPRRTASGYPSSPG